MVEPASVVREIQPHNLSFEIAGLTRETAQKIFVKRGLKVVGHAEIHWRQDQPNPDPLTVEVGN